MNTVRKFIMGFAGITILVIICFMFNFTDLSWNGNGVNYILIFSQICIITSMIFSNRHEKTKKIAN